MHLKTGFTNDAKLPHILDDLFRSCFFERVACFTIGKVTFEDAEDVAVKSLVLGRTPYYSAGGSRKCKSSTNIKSTISALSHQFDY